MSTLLRRFGLFLLTLANRLEQRNRFTVALEPLAVGASHEEHLYEVRHRAARYY